MDTELSPVDTPSGSELSSAIPCRKCDDLEVLLGAVVCKAREYWSELQDRITEDRAQVDPDCWSFMLGVFQGALDGQRARITDLEAKLAAAYEQADFLRGALADANALLQKERI